MNNTKKKLDALIDALGFDVKEVVNDDLLAFFGGEIPASLANQVSCVTHYELTKRPDPLTIRYDSVPLEQLIRNIIDLSLMDEQFRWIRYHKQSFNAVVRWFYGIADKQSDTLYLIMGVEVFLDE